MNFLARAMLGSLWARGIIVGIYSCSYFEGSLIVRMTSFC